MPKLKDPTKLKDIHDACVVLINKHGFSGLIMADVAQSALIATGTLYVYYKSKESLINEVYRQTKKEFIAALVDSKNATPDFFQTFKNMWLSYFSFCLANPQKMMFVEKLVYSGYIDKEIIAETENALMPLNQFLEYGIAQGKFKNTHLELMKAQMQGSIFELIKTITQQHIYIDDSDKNVCFAMTWDAMRR